MKKTIWIIALVVLALGIFGIGAVLAQEGDQPYGPGMMGGRGWIHEYVTQALADKLGLTQQQVEDQLAGGKTMYQIALDNGVAEEDIASLLTEVHTAAFDQAVADGVLTREQADAMLQRMQSMWANGYAPGNCPMHNGQYGQPGQSYGPGMMRNWTGGQRGPGAMMQGWWNQNP